VCTFISLVLLLVVLPVAFFAVNYPPSRWRQHGRTGGLQEVVRSLSGASKDHVCPPPARMHTRLSCSTDQPPLPAARCPMPLLLLVGRPGRR
jgi:hypothetical protein